MHADAAIWVVGDPGSNAGRTGAVDAADPVVFATVVYAKLYATSIVPINKEEKDFI